MPKRILRRSVNDDERRRHKRLPIERDVRYKVLGSGKNKEKIRGVGLGKTINMSSGGVLFTTDSGLAEGDRVELAIDWPAQLEGRLRLKMVVFGHVVRAEQK